MTTTSPPGSAHDAPVHSPSHPAACENCTAPLQGAFCAQCGQSAHNPLRSFGHALEEVFESFWHLDGRIFRTMRDLFAPGRLPRNYLAGHRVGYIPPLRLFVVLSLLTFFVGKLVVHFGNEQGLNVVVADPAHVPAALADAGAPGTASEFARAKTVDEVRAIERRLLAPIERQEHTRSGVPGVSAALILARTSVQGAAAARIAELEHKPAAERPAQDDIHLFDDGAGHAWDPSKEPVHVGWLPGFANRWLTAKAARVQQNIRRMSASGDWNDYAHAVLASVPPALFLLMPVFALLLKVLYLGSGRTYLEHLVVALYSHAFLLVMLFALFVLAALDDAGVSGWVTGLGDAAVAICTPLYLLLTQKRVYGGGWWSTLLRYVVIGNVYFVLVLLVVVYAFLAGLTS